MGIKLKTKEERQADAAKLASKRPDTPLANTPEPTAWVTDAESALTDINKRASQRQASKTESDKKLAANRVERSKQKTPLSGSRLIGLESFGSKYSRKE